MKVFTAAQMREFDRVATEEYSIPSIVLMENAALRVVEFLEMKFAPLEGKRVLVLCGKGNNGGDGFAIARHLQRIGLYVVALTTFSPDFNKPPISDAEINIKILHQTEIAVGSDVSWAQEYWTPNIQSGDIVIDALFGTGFKGKVDSATLEAIRWIKDQKRRGVIVVSVDMASAVSADTGEAALEAVHADYTVTLASPKRGMFLRDGIENCGEIWVGGIGTPPSWIEEFETGCECFTRETARYILQLYPRHLNAHKGDAGRVLLIGGSYGMSGAPTLAAQAALKSGAGLCVAALPDKIISTFARRFPEATSHPLPCSEKGVLVESAADELPALWENVNAVALGPGISREGSTLDFVRRVVRECPQPLIIDADALYALRAIESDLKNRDTPTILTPHPGEMGELMEMNAQEVNDNRIETAIACAQKFNAIVVLKGARSIVVSPVANLVMYINLTGNAGMATGGSGDVLTGTIAGLLAQTKYAQNATLLGVYLHGMAGDLAFETLGNGLIAGDIADNLPRALVELAKPIEPPTNARLRKLE